jgi:outer membrane protein assembly factor BamB
MQSRPPCALPALVALAAAVMLGQLHFHRAQASPPAGDDPEPAVNNWIGQADSEEVEPLVPLPFRAKGTSIKGWKVVIAAQSTLATPAVAGGKVMLGAGFAGNMVYAFDAVTGKKVWEYQAADNGPTAVVAQDGYLAFNTESCELEILTTAGKPVWKKWLGDPLASMPAIAAGNVIMAYPDSNGDRSYYLACFDLKTGKEQWKQKIAGELITAPVVANERIYAATVDGTLSCLAQRDGEVLWKDKQNATSSPVVWNNSCYFSRREEVIVTKGGKKVKQQTERIAMRGLGVKADLSNLLATARPADYLDAEKRQAAPLNNPAGAGPGFAGIGGGIGGIAGIGGGLGFAGAGLANDVLQAAANIGQFSVPGVWSYQGSKPFIYRDRLYQAMGDTLECVDPKTERILWKKSLRPSKVEKAREPTAGLEAEVTPPALANGKVFVGTAHGDVTCLSAESGKVLWQVHIGEPVTFQPAVAKGRVYVATARGSLYCLETGDENDDGWLMWGADAAHNGGTGTK